MAPTVDLVVKEMAVNSWAWSILAVVVMIWTCREGKEGLGKIITYPMVMLLIKKQSEKLHKKTDAGTVTQRDFYRALWVLKHVFATPSRFRLWQLAVLYVIWFPISFAVNFGEPDPFILIWIALYADDLLTGGKNKWKKRWKSLKNKVKWKMLLPKPANQPS